MAASVVLHGPQGSGKTLIAERLAKHLRLSRVIDIEEPHTVRPLPVDGALVVVSDLLDVRGFNARRIHITEALGLLGLKRAQDVLEGTAS